jgi:5-methylcytosine-specific restriction endonuclease McrA
MPKPKSDRKRKIVSVLFKEQDGRCFYCDREMIDPLGFDLKAFMQSKIDAGEKAQVPNLYPTLDHRDPADNGGSWHVSNLVAACWDCNHKKANYILPESLVSDRPLMVQLFRSGQIKHYMKGLPDAA